MSQSDERRGAVAPTARALTAETVQQHLSGLGKNPYTLAFVFTTATLCDLHLTDLHAISEFPNLQHVVCSKNLLRSLAPLRALRLLLSVDASHNQLTQALDFDVPACTPASAWVDGSEWIGSLLRKADLSYNCITSVRALSTSHPFLQELHLAHNGIREVRGVSALRFLRVLDLSHNRLANTKGLLPPGFLGEARHAPRANNNNSGDDHRENEGETPYLEALEVLRLGHNQLTTIDEVVGLPRLTELDVSHNKLKSVSCLEHCARLQSLSVAHNELASVNDVNCLLSLPFLQRLELAGCPFVALEPSRVLYRARVLRRLQQLAELDGDEVSAKEKTKALAMHGSEIASRKEVLAAFLPREEFVNFLPPLDFDEDAELVKFYEARFGGADVGPENPHDGAEPGGGDD